MATLAKLIETHGIEVLEHLDRQVDIPVLTGPQRQGDVFIFPNPKATATTPVPTSGIPVVKGENDGNTHAIFAEGDIRVDLGARMDLSSLTIATLSVAEGSVAHLHHPEHGYMGIGAGSYEIRRQREQADEIRMVQD